MKNIFRNNIRVTLIGIVLLSLGACDNEYFLNRYPKDAPNPSNFFVNDVTARQAVNACYSPWLFNTHMFQRDMTILMDALTDDSYPSPNRADEVALDQWNITPISGQIVSWWRYPYQSINAANFAIDNIPSSTDPTFTPEKQAPFIAEAKFLRAYSYLFLTAFYGDIPLLTSAASDFTEFNTPRSPRADVMAQVVKDFTYAKDSLPATQKVYGPPPKAAAAAYLAKTYLILKDWPKAEAAAREAIQIAEGSGHKLQDNYLSIWTDEKNPEVLFAWTYVENISNAVGENYTVQRLCRNLPTTLKVGIYGDGWSTCNPQRSLYDAFEADDPRLNYTLIYPGSDFAIYNGTTNFNYTHETYNSTGQKVTWNVTYHPGDMVQYDYRWSVTGLNTRKGLRSMKPLVNTYQSGQDWPVMRMGELYLILAEALAQEGNAEALTWVNKVRARPSVNVAPRSLNDSRPGGNSLVDIVRHERRVELALEGLRIFDLLRWGTLSQVFGDGKQVKRNFFSDFGVAEKYDAPIGNLTLDPVFPIPQYELDHNTNVTTNNPGF